MILESLIKEYSVSEEVQRSLNIYIGGFIMLLREWLENPNFESMEAVSYTHLPLYHPYYNWF